jgi:hypothetical protein
VTYKCFVHEHIQHSMQQGHLSPPDSTSGVATFCLIGKRRHEEPKTEPGRNLKSSQMKCFKMSSGLYEEYSKTTAQTRPRSDTPEECAWGLIHCRHGTSACDVSHMLCLKMVAGELGALPDSCVIIAELRGYSPATRPVGDASQHSVCLWVQRYA